MSATTSAPATPMATEKQVAFIRRLIGERELTAKTATYFDVALTSCEATLTRHLASTMIDYLLKLPKPQAAPKTQAAPDETVEDGIYVHDGVFVKVVKAVHGSGKPYAKRFDVTNLAWVYAPGLVQRLSTGERVTKEQAAEFGALYGKCVRCGRTLTNEASIEQAMGPVCSGKMGW